MVKETLMKIGASFHSIKYSSWLNDDHTDLAVKAIKNFIKESMKTLQLKIKLENLNCKINFHFLFQHLFPKSKR